jgi:hypothetical protein
VLELVFDKSFLDGASRQLVSEACATHKALCTESLFFELMTTRPGSQVRCFAKLPDRPRSFALIPNVGTLLRFELENRTPCIPLSDRRIEGTYVFNPKLRDGTYVPEREVLDTMSTWRAQIAQDAMSFLQRCQVVYQFFPQLDGIEFRDLPAAVSAVRRVVATDEGLVRSIYESFLDENAPSDALPPAMLNPEWAWFRWVQCQLLAALRIFQRYQCRVPDPPTPNVLLRAEHSLHDLDYVLLGSLAGGIATNDTEVEEDFRLVRPDGLVLSLHSK